MTETATISLDHLSSQRLKALLGLAVKPDRAGGSLPTAVAEPSEFERLLTELCRGRGESGDLLITTVCAEDTPLEVLMGIKELAKRLVAGARTESHSNAATLLYHAAVAAAVARHGANVSSLPLGERLSLCEDLAVALAGHPLGEVFRAAVERAENATAVR
jgi:hypothetical protein